MSALRIKLGDAVTFLGGGTPSKSREDFWGGAIPWATVKDLQGTELKETLECITELGVERSATRVIPPKTVVIPTRMALGRAAITSCEMAINQDLKALVPQIEIDERYLLRVMLHLKPAIERLGSGSTVKGVTLEKLQKLEIPVPPIEQQKRVAGVLDRADALREMCELSLENLDKLQQSVFLDMFGDPYINPKGWDMGVVGDLLSSTTYGTSKKANETEGEFPILRMGNLTYSGAIDMSNLKYIDLEKRDIPRHLVSKGEILFNRTNSRELVGKTAVYRFDEPTAYAGYLIKGVPNELCNVEYLGAFMNLPGTKTYLKNKCRNIVGMANINAREFVQIPIPIVPKPMQDDFGRFVKQLEIFRSSNLKQLKELNSLSGSLQRIAFTGAL